jgi:hypothetical protein
MMHLVFGVTRGATVSTDTLRVSGSTSQKMGRAPISIVHCAPATNVKDGMITSSPGFTPIAIKARCNPAVQLFNATAYGTPHACAKACSNSCVEGPVVSHPFRIEWVTDAISSSPTDGRQ